LYSTAAKSHKKNGTSKDEYRGAHRIVRVTGTPGFADQSIAHGAAELPFFSLTARPLGNVS
jgi:hypothetical protein